MFVCIKRSKRDLFWGLHNKKGAWYFGGNKSSTTKFQQGAKPGVHIERIEQTGVSLNNDSWLYDSGSWYVCCINYILGRGEPTPAGHGWIALTLTIKSWSHVSCFRLPHDLQQSQWRSSAVRTARTVRTGHFLARPHRTRPLRWGRLMLPVKRNTAKFEAQYCSYPSTAIGICHIWPLSVI